MDLFDQYRVIDVDTHVTEPADTWSTLRDAEVAIHLVALRQVEQVPGVTGLIGADREDLVAPAPQVAVLVIEHDATIGEVEAVRRHRQARITVDALRQTVAGVAGRVVDVDVAVVTDRRAERVHALFLVLVGEEREDGIAAVLHVVDAVGAGGDAEGAVARATVGRAIAIRPDVVEEEHAVLLDHRRRGDGAFEARIPAVAPAGLDDDVIGAVDRLGDAGLDERIGLGLGLGVRIRIRLGVRGLTGAGSLTGIGDGLDRLRRGCDRLGSTSVQARAEMVSRRSNMVESIERTRGACSSMKSPRCGSKGAVRDALALGKTSLAHARFWGRTPGARRSSARGCQRTVQWVCHAAHSGDTLKSYVEKEIGVCCGVRVVGGLAHALRAARTHVAG